MVIDMSKSFFFSINLLIKSESHLEKCIDTIIHDEAFFLENIQLLLIDTLCSQYSLEVCTKYSRKYPENVYFVDASGRTDGESYNDAKPLCLGTYCCYTNNYGEYSKQTFPELIKILKNGRIPVICIRPCYAPSGKSVQNYLTDNTPGLVDLKQNPERFCMMLGSYFFHRKTAQPLLFDRSSEIHNEIKFIAEALMINYSYIFHPDCTYTINTPCEREPFKYAAQYNRTFYSQTIDNSIIPMLKAYPGSALVQSMMLYLIEMRFSLNADEKYKHVIIGNYVDEFFDKVSEALNFIDDCIILNKRICRMCQLDEEMPFRLIRLKYKNKELKPDIDIAAPNAGIEQSYFRSNGRLENTVLNGEFVASVNRAAVSGSRDINAEILSVNSDEEGIYVDAVLYGCSFMNEKDYRIFVNINGERNEVIRSGVYTLRKFFDRPFLKRFAFRFFVPVSSGKTMDTFYLTMKYGRLSFRIGMTFNGVFSRLSTRIQNSYWLFRDRVMTYDRKTRSVVIRRASDILVRRCESKFLSEAGQLVGMSERMYYRQMRKAVRNALQEKLDHRYIMFYDENGINSNGNVLFRYFSKHKDNEKLEVFFTARRGSDEQEYLVESEYENVLEAGAKKSKLTALCSDVIVATDCDVYESLFFNETDILFLKDLLNARIVSVKDFFFTYASAQFDNRLRDNIQLFYCSSQIEKEHVLHEVYDYDEAMIRITGYPVLDTLSDKKEKLILAAPVERRQFCIYDNSEHYRFSESRFFKLYNKLLSDTRLLRRLRESKCRLAFLVPQSIEKFSGLFYSNDYVRIYSSSGESENDLINRASMLITDNSDIQYLFAYMNKPVAYYYPHGLPIQQEYKDEGLAENSFGELFFDHDPLIDFIIKSIDDGFSQPEKYSKQCNDFFRYHDSNNSKRIFKSIVTTFFPELYRESN